MIEELTKQQKEILKRKLDAAKQLRDYHQASANMKGVEIEEIELELASLQNQANTVQSNESN